MALVSSVYGVSEWVSVCVCKLLLMCFLLFYDLTGGGGGQLLFHVGAGMFGQLFPLINEIIMHFEFICIIFV